MAVSGLFDAIGSWTAEEIRSFCVVGSANVGEMSLAVFWKASAFNCVRFSAA